MCTQTRKHAAKWVSVKVEVERARIERKKKTCRGKLRALNKDDSAWNMQIYRI